MNPQDKAWEDLELTELEASLEQELAALEPWRPSLHLRNRIDAEAARQESGSREETAPLVASRFSRIRRSHVLAVAAAMAALITVAVMPLWMPGRESGDGVAESGVAKSQQETGTAADQESGGLILWDRVPGTGEPVNLRRDQILIGGESVGVVEPEQGPAMWRVRYRLLNRTSWKDEETGTMREQFVPEERVLFVPVRHH